MTNLVTIAFVLFVWSSTCDSKSYRDHSLVHATPQNDAILEFFKNLDRFYNVTFWRRPSLVKKPIEFSISRFELAELRRDTKDMDIDFITIIRDLQSAFDNQTLKPYVRRKMESFDWVNYYSLDDIYGWLRDLSEMYPKEVQLQTIGQTFEDRNLLVVKVTLENSKKRSKVMLEGGCHAREWISPAFVTYFINAIINAKNSTNRHLKKIANLYEWIFIPVLNPDGYVYSQTTDRLWRKNHRGGYGVDLNRNFGISFGTRDGSATDKNSEEYCGEAAFSEAESAALATFAKDNGKNMEYYLAFHSYGQFIIIPYGFKMDYMDNFHEVKNMADQVAKRSLQKYGIPYSTGTAYDTVGYLAPGISADWVKKSINVSYAVTFELPDQGQFGFALPPGRILPTCEATMDMLLHFLEPQTESFENTLRMSNGGTAHRDTGAIVVCFVLCIFNR